MEINIVDCSKKIGQQASVATAKPEQEADVIAHNAAVQQKLAEEAAAAKAPTGDEKTEAIAKLTEIIAGLPGVSLPQELQDFKTKADEYLGEK